MALLDSIKTALTNDLHIAEADVHQLAATIVGDGEQTFSTLLDTVLKSVESRPIGEILKGVYGIYKELKAAKAPVTSAPA